MSNHLTYTDEQRKEIVKDFLENGNGNKTGYAQKHNISRDSLRSWIKRFEHQIEYGIKDDQSLKGISRLESWRDESGNYQAQWLKIDIKQEEAAEKLRSIAEGLISDIKPIQEIEFRRACNSALCSLYVISDFHLGQYSWVKETGEEWSLEKAYQIITHWIDEATHQAPDSKQGVLCDLGDFLHCDGILPITPSSGHILDVDGRFFEVIDVMIAIFDYMIKKLLDKHENVRVIICEGNHNQTTAHLTSRMIARKYELNPRLTFDMTDLPYYAFQWGKTATFFHHGHKKRINQVAESLAASYRKIFGECRYRYAHVGHLHHREVRESALMVVEQHSTLAAKDAHSARGGYHSERGASVITYHKDFGEVSRTTIRPEMLL